MTTPSGPESPADPTAGGYGAMPPAPESYGAPAMPSGMPELASWGHRVGAYLLDGLIATGILVVGLVLGAVLGAGSDSLGGFVMVLGYVAALVYWVWQLVVQGQTGQTIGKRVVGIRLLREQDGQPVGPGLSIARQFVHAIDKIPCMLGYLWPLWDDKRQTFTDKVLSSVVIKV